MHRIHCCIITTTFIPTHLHSLSFFSVTTLVPTIDPLQLLYGTLNKLLRDEDRSKLKPFFPYLKLLLTALQRLPNIKQMVGWDAMW